MDLVTFFRQSKVLIVAGKGGVGKSTVSATMALASARAGLSALIVDLEGKTAIRTAFGLEGSLDYEEVLLHSSEAGAARARRITPDDALLEYLADHGLKRVSKRLVSSGALEVVATAIPGIRDILVLGKIKQLERREIADVIIVDAPATGHAMTFLTSASGLLEAARSGPVRTQAQEVVEFLSDPSRCRVILVTLPEEMPVAESIETAYQLEDRAGVTLGPVVVNGCLEPLPPAVTLSESNRKSLLDSLHGPFNFTGSETIKIIPSADLLEGMAQAAAFHDHRRIQQIEQRQRLAEELPLPQLHLPYLFRPSSGLNELHALAESLSRGIAGMPDPAGKADDASNMSDMSGVPGRKATEL
ncbi:MAG: ArsA family ATPase [Actinobacteria bacterium]|nr:ArsA family ATPase [Actinomycetota bacterium]MCL5447153.1 ArsA family ATPase [Actinomycetota bacterium]